MPSALATTTTSALLAGSPGRAIATARGHHVVVDSPPPLGGPNEELNPLDALLSALATCAVFVCETAAREQDVPLRSAEATVEADFDPRGVKGADVDPRIQAFRLTLALEGPTDGQAEALVAAFRARCPIYTTLSRAAPIEIRVERG